MDRDDEKRGSSILDESKYNESMNALGGGAQYTVQRKPTEGPGNPTGPTEQGNIKNLKTEGTS